jgi:hypothetical protein
MSKLNFLVVQLFGLVVVTVSDRSPCSLTAIGALMPHDCMQDVKIGHGDGGENMT